MSNNGGHGEGVTIQGQWTEFPPDFPPEVSEEEFDRAISVRNNSFEEIFRTTLKREKPTVPTDLKMQKIFSPSTWRITVITKHSRTSNGVLNYVFRLRNWHNYPSCFRKAFGLAMALRVNKHLKRKPHLKVDPPPSPKVKFRPNQGYYDVGVNVVSLFDGIFYPGKVTGRDWEEGEFRYEVEFDDGEVVEGMKFWEIWTEGTTVEEIEVEVEVPGERVGGLDEGRVPRLMGGGEGEREMAEYVRERQERRRRERVASRMMQAVGRGWLFRRKWEDMEVDVVIAQSVWRGRMVRRELAKNKL
ncbi:hypothetical protein TrVE_jg1902 [Triparma verrucosa]|uniref:Uncharacterized protein n=1 Tax=Triparma verrucosa TaxID=1606542 RepID=A0A9W7BW87_9STRA|nr:hypothetical protein TrVE_jg1902 [Triparma verrucosa]